MKRTYPVVDMVRTGQNIKKIMLAKGLSVKDVQKFLELGTPQAIYHWFEGKSMPTLDNLYALSDLFCLPIDMILRGNRKFIFMPSANTMLRRMYSYYELLQELTA